MYVKRWVPEVLILLIILIAAVYAGNYFPSLNSNAALSPPSRNGPLAAPANTQCGDHLDNDGDGYCDYRTRRAFCSDGSQLGDSECSSKSDTTEAAPIPPVNTCTNLIKDGSETDVDCGGSCSTKCSLDKSCTSNSDCSSNYCYGGKCTQQPTTPSTCNPLQGSTSTTAGHVNLVFVPSGFNGDMNLFAQKASWVFDQFKQYTPFKNVPQLNAFYVPTESGDYCYFNCNNIARLLCCDITKATTASSTCTSGSRQTIVIQNSDTYGGAGYRGANVATTSLNSLAPKVAVHEIGHSLFNLGDEYTGQTNSGPTSSANCDYVSCSRWSNMFGFNGVNCRSTSCSGGQYYTSETTMMRDLSYQFEEVNERRACCTYYEETGSFPLFCDKFNQFAPSGDLSEYCKIDPLTSTSSSAPPEIEMENPYQYILVKNDAGEWKVQSISQLKKGKYSSREILGEGSGGISVALDNGVEVKNLQFEESDNVEYTSEDGKLGGYSKVQRNTIVVIAEHSRGKIVKLLLNNKNILGV